MPSLRIITLQSIIEMISQKRSSALEEDRLTTFENDLIDTVVNAMHEIGQPVNNDEVEVLWTPVFRGANSTGVHVDILYTENMMGADGTGFVTTIEDRRRLQAKVLEFLTTTELLPNVSVSAWVMPQEGASFGMETRVLTKA